MAISLGAIFGGPESTEGQRVFRQMSSAFVALRTAERPFLNVVFHFPGSLLKPEHEGLRTGRFSKKDQGFMIQVAVPSSIAECEIRPQIAQFILQAIREAVEISKPRWTKHGIQFNFDEAYSSIQAVAQQFGGTGFA